jgi:hypothetical protein
MLAEMRQDIVKGQCRRGTQTQISSFFKHGLSNTKFVVYINCFQGWCQNLHFYILWQVNLFNDMESKFQNKAVLPKETCEVLFVTPLNIFSVALP